MTARQVIFYLLGFAFFTVMIGLLFVGQAYLDKGDIAPVEHKATSSTPQVTAQASESSGTPKPQTDTGPLLRQAISLLQEKQPEAALEKVNAAIEIAPDNADAYALRGGIHAEGKLWDEAESDYRVALQLDNKNVRVKFNLAEIEFMQKKYDAARPGFVSLQDDKDMGDLATYKVFLCDLFGGREDVAATELDSINKAETNASYYFANASWSLYHKKTEDARGWLSSAESIYSPNKFRLYAASLVALGYLPLPAPQSH